MVKASLGSRTDEMKPENILPMRDAIARYGRYDRPVCS